MRGQIAEQIESVEFKASLVSGQQVLELSGETKLHSIIVGRKTSGQLVTVFDSAISGRYLSAGTVVLGLLYGGDANNVPVQVDFNVKLESGLVIVSSGAVWNLTVLTKKA